MISYKKVTFTIIILLLLVGSILPSAVRAAPLQTSRTRTRYVYVINTPSRRFPQKADAKKPTSWWSQISQKVGPAVLGSGGVILGAVVAWYTLRRKTKALDDYFDKIMKAEGQYHLTIAKPDADKKKAQSDLKTELTSIQEEVEMAVARKKLDQEQLIAISNKIDRILDKKS